MLVAIDENENLVNLLEDDQRDLIGNYFCPACHGRLRLKNGQIKIPHFAHQSLQDCDFWSENESTQHLGLKMELYHWLSQTEKVEIERYLPELNQTPDLLVNDKIAFEVQCSSLSLKRLRERSENYRKHGYTVIWLMGKDLWLSQSMSELQKNLMYFSENRGFYFWELDLDKQKLRLKSLIHQDLRGKIIHLTEEFSFGQGNLLEILRRPFFSQNLAVLEIKKDPKLVHFVQQQLFHRSAKWLKIQEKYYQAGKNLLEEDFNRPFFAPPGLDLLFEHHVESFIQTPQNVATYYQNFTEKFQKNCLENLYPPRFYAIMKESEK